MSEKKAMHFYTVSFHVQTGGIIQLCYESVMSRGSGVCKKEDV
jgi:hypothetical protein